MSSDLKHNKKRSTAIVYELLLRRVSENLVEGNKRGATETLSLMKRYFSSNEPIGRELEVIDVLRSQRGISAQLASRVISEVKLAASKLDRKLIEIKKSNLIKEINVSFGKEFFSSYRLADYRALASMQVFVEACGKQATMTEGLHRAQIENAILTYMTTNESDAGSSYDPDRNTLSYGLALEKFKKKYGAQLSSEQRKLLEAYVGALFSGEYKQFRAVLAEDQRSIYKDVVGFSRSKECREDDVLRKRITEAATRLQALKPVASEETVSEMMLFHDLSKEIKSNG